MEIFGLKLFERRDVEYRHSIRGEITALVAFHRFTDLNGWSLWTHLLSVHKVYGEFIIIPLPTIDTRLISVEVSGFKVKMVWAK